MTPIQKKLFAMADADYRTFQTKLMPTVDPDTVIGVRTPALRGLAKELRGTEEADAFLRQLPHTYYEENNLHGYLLEFLSEYDEAVKALNAFLPFVNNWATCDTLSPKALGTNLPALQQQCRAWMASHHPYTVRYGIGMLMRYFLDSAFQPECLEWVASVSTGEYYVNMMIAWYFATALAKQPADTLPYITQQRLPVFIHNKAIQKAVESRRIPPQFKQLLRSHKIH